MLMHPHDRRGAERVHRRRVGAHHAVASEHTAAIGKAQFVPIAVAARDGRRTVVRPARAADAPLLQQLVRGLSPQSRRNRFFGPVRELSPAQLDRITHFDATTGLALVAIAGGDAPRIVGIAENAVYDPPFAEFAVVVADDWQRQGLGERLMALLLTHAARTGVAAVQGLVMATNGPMLALASKLGFAFLEDADPDLVWIERRLGRMHGVPA
jgi:acetyltransferase